MAEWNAQGTNVWTVDEKEEPFNKYWLQVHYASGTKQEAENIAKLIATLLSKSEDINTRG